MPFAMSHAWRRLGPCLLLPVLLLGCGKAGPLLPEKSFHDQVGWKAEEYFDDPQVVALCKAIEADDLKEMERLIRAGANVNAQGKGKMTPLMWAFPGNKLARFKLLLEHGADPNVITEDDFGTRGTIMKGTSVTHQAASTWHPGFFEAVFAHGGDPNLEQQTQVLGRGYCPLHLVIWSPVSGKLEKLQKLLDLGANINHIGFAENTPVALAVKFRQYDIALMLLESGADYMIYTNPDSNQRLVHLVLASAVNLDYTRTWAPGEKQQYNAVLEWLKGHGEPLEKARQDLKRWNSWNRRKGEYARNMAIEVAERKAREAAEKQQPADDKDGDGDK